MDTVDLKLLALVARLGGFSAAARTLGTDPSTVSRRVAHAEDRLGFRVFRRSTRSMSLTEAGSTFLTQIEPLLADLELAQEEGRKGRRRPRGHLRMTASSAFAQECITPHLGHFLNKYPDISVDLIATDTNLDLLENDIDLAIRLTAEPNGELISTGIMRTRYRVVAAPAYLDKHGAPEAPADLGNRDCLRYSLPGRRNAWHFRDPGGKESEVKVGGRLTITGALPLREAVRDGLGPALLADWMVDDDIAAGRLVDLFPNHRVTATDFNTQAYALYPSRIYLPRKVQVMVKHLRRSLKHRPMPEARAAA